MADKGGGGGGDPGDNVMAVVIGGCLLLGLLWLFAHESISAAMLKLRWLELLPLSLVSEQAGSQVQRITEIKAQDVTFAQMQAMLGATGETLRWVFAPLLGLLAGVFFMRKPFRKVHTMESLTRQEAALWPEIAPVVGKDLVSGDITKGPWAVAATEWEFARKHNLVPNAGDAEQLDDERTREVFAAQLGPLWRGPQALPVHARAIYAALLIALVGDPKQALARLREVATQVAAGGVEAIKTEWVVEAIREHDGCRLAQLSREQHAYVFTVLATMLQVARRKNGVLASSLMVWLKPVDRRLWYVMNSVGRYAFHVEAAGVMAHWLAEKQIGERLTAPCVEKAVIGLQSALEEYIKDDNEARLFH